MDASTQQARPIHALMQGLIDYAGLFPPAKLDMPAAVRNYDHYLQSQHAWMLGRFILPVSRLEEFRKASASVLPRNGDEDEPWPLSVLIDGELDENLDAIYAFNREHADESSGLAVIDAVEIKVPLENGSPLAQFVDDTLDRVPDELFPFFELPAPGIAGADIRGCLAVLSDADAAAKLRTGGVTADSVPPAKNIAEFILACAGADVPFKATAGLHHAIRAEHGLTYEPNCPRSIMHGFLNVFIAAALAKQSRISADTLARVLEERDPKAFSFSDTRLTWRDHALGMDQLEDARHGFALSYGSCSFEEPTQELTTLGLI
jgi:hypothetical protein